MGNNNYIEMILRNYYHPVYYHPVINFKVPSNVSLLCNNIPGFSVRDECVIRRLINVEYLTKTNNQKKLEHLMPLSFDLKKVKKSQKTHLKFQYRRMKSQMKNHRQSKKTWR